MIGPDQAPALVLGRRVLTLLSVQAVGQHRHRLPSLWLLLLGTDRQAGPLAAEQVRPGQFRVSPRPSTGVSGPDLRDDTRGVALPPAGERDIGPFTRLTAAEHGLAAGHGAALPGVAGDRVAEIGRGEFGRRVEHRPLRQLLVLKDPPDEQPFTDDRLDDEPVPVGERVSRIGDELVVVLPCHDQVPGRGSGPGGQRRRAVTIDEAEVNQVVADDPAQLAAILPGIGHQQHLLACQPGGDVGAAGILEHLSLVAAGDPAVLVIGLERALVALAQPQAGPPLPLGGEPDRHRELGVPEVAREQAHPAAAFHRGELLVIAADEQLGVVPLGQAHDLSEVGHRDGAALIDDDQGPLRQPLPRLSHPAQEPGGVPRVPDPGLGEHVPRGL